MPASRLCWQTPLWEGPATRDALLNGILPISVSTRPSPPSLPRQINALGLIFLPKNSIFLKKVKSLRLDVGQ